jgi:hypothetical protein
MIDENVQVDANVQVSPDAIARTRSKAAGFAMKRPRVAQYFGVPEEDVDEDMLLMYEQAQEQM